MSDYVRNMSDRGQVTLGNLTYHSSHMARVSERESLSLFSLESKLKTAASDAVRKANSLSLAADAVTQRLALEMGWSDQFKPEDCDALSPIEIEDIVKGAETQETRSKRLKHLEDLLEGLEIK